MHVSRAIDEFVADLAGRCVAQNEDAPETVGAVRGGDQTPSIQEEDQIVNTIIPDTDAARQAVREWTTDYVTDRQDFGHSHFKPDGWPAVATPSWASEVEVGEEISGEVTILFAHELGEVALVSSVAVVVSDDEAFDDNHPGLTVGDILPEPSGVTLRVVGDHEELRATDAMRLFDSLATAIVLLRKIEAAA